MTINEQVLQQTRDTIIAQEHEQELKAIKEVCNTSPQS
ncbi:hypothetical protein ID866_10618 [Astraeus odoratus]|nr:hypothetical protein ID866_10618 [Astraeus odoratus]